MIARLKTDNQISNLEFDINNNLTGNEEFQKYLETMDDFEKFEIQRYLIRIENIYFGFSENEYWVWIENSRDWSWKD